MTAQTEAPMARARWASDRVAPMPARARTYRRWLRRQRWTARLRSRPHAPPARESVAKRGHSESECRAPAVGRLVM